MLCNSASYYPNKVDEMIFFQDNNLEKIEIMNHYNSLIAQGDYIEANDYQEYLLQKPPKKQPFIYYDEEIHFPMEELHIFSDTDEEEDLSSILLFSEDEEPESIEDLYTFTGEEAEPPVVNKDTIWI